MLQPGSPWWLMRHEFRLHWRGRSKTAKGKIAVIILLIVLHLIAIPAAFAIKHLPPFPQRTMALYLTISGACIFGLMISRALITAVQALYTRGDMDLLLSSPISAQAIIAVRVSFIAASVTLEFAVLIWPFATVFVLSGLFAWLKAYILLPALGLLASSIGLLLALILFYAFGARRTRVIAQVMSAIIAGGFTLLVQLPNIMRNTPGVRSTPGRGTPFLGSQIPASPMLDGVLLAPGRLAMHGFVSSVALAAACAGIFALTVWLFGQSFVRASVAAAGVSVGKGSRGKRARTSSAALRFRNSTRIILILKELRLIARDPWLLTQLFQQSIFVLPFWAVMWRQNGTREPIVWGAMIFLAGTTASALAWLTVAAEDVPELLASAPLSRLDIVRVKLEAALLPTLPLILLPVLVLWRTHFWFGLSVAICALGSAASCALLNVRDRPPARRSDFRIRNKGNVGRGLVELAVMGGWILVCTLMVRLSPWR